MAAPEALDVWWAVGQLSSVAGYESQLAAALMEDPRVSPDSRSSAEITMIAAASLAVSSRMVDGYIPPHEAENIRRVCRAAVMTVLDDLMFVGPRADSQN